MRLSFGQQLKMAQKQILAPRMIQSMEILQLPILALQERIEQEIEENPVLDQCRVGLVKQSFPSVLDSHLKLFLMSQCLLRTEIYYFWNLNTCTARKKTTRNSSAELGAPPVIIVDPSLR